MRLNPSITLFALVLCIALVLVAGCTSEKNLGRVAVPGTVNGNGPATFEFVSPGGSHIFHVVSTGSHAGMIVTVEGLNVDDSGKVLAHIVENTDTTDGVDETKKLNMFTQETYKITVMTINDAAPWSIQIS